MVSDAIISPAMIISFARWTVGHVYSEDIEALADTAVETHVFAFLAETIIKSCLFQQEVGQRSNPSH